MADTPSRRRRGAPADLGAILAGLAQRSGDLRLRQASVGAAVADAIGPFLARRLTGLSLDGDRCAVEMRDAASAKEVARHGSLVLERLRRRLGALAPSSLSVTHARSPSASRAPTLTPPRERDAPHLTPSDLPLAHRALELLEDPAERERVQRWLRLVPAAPAPQP